MRKLGISAVALVSSLALAGVASAAEPAAKAAPAAAAKPEAAVVAPVKAGDSAYVCGCGPECKCGSIQAGPGKCACGKDLVKATVTKVEGDKISVKIEGAKAEQVFKAPYKCGCGGGCNCTPAALGPGKCKCGKELVKNN
jgi:hypothetical protein